MSNARVAIVTGASSGVGRATALLLAEAGFGLVLVARREARLAETRARVQETPGPPPPCIVVPTDLCDPAATRAIVDRTLDHFGRLDALANVAGFAPLGPIRDTTPELWRQVIDTNLSAAVHLTAAGWDALGQQDQSVVVNVSSMASIDPFPGLGLYAAAKIGLNMFTRATAQEGKNIGLRAVCIAPGAIETPMLRGLFDTRAIPKDQALDPREVAALIRDCITGERAFESGEVIQLTAGA